MKPAFALALCVAGALCACSNDPNALYAPAANDAGDNDAGGAPHDAVLPLLPAQPDMKNKRACETCAKDKCADARASCMQDDACIAMLSCKGQCWNPACLERCDVEQGFSIWYRDYFDCVLGASGQGQCSVECATGQNWDCLGKYEYRTATRDDYAVDLHMVGPQDSDDPGRTISFPVLEGATVRACGSAAFEDCDTEATNVLSSATVGAYGRVSLALRGQYDSFLRIEGGATSESSALYYPPLTGAQRRDAPFFGRIFRNLYHPGDYPLTDPGFPIDGPDRTNVFPIAVDCLLLPAPGVRFALAGEADPDAAYFGPAGKSGANQTQTGVSVLGIELGGAPNRVLVVEARRADGGELLAQRQVVVGARWSTQVILSPLTRGER